MSRNEHEHHDMRMSLGAYVLGQLSADETTILEAHLDTCPDCMAELAALTPVANALGQLRGQRQPDDTLVPPADLGDRLCRRSPAQHDATAARRCCAPLH